MIAATQNGRRNHRLGWDELPLIDRQETVVKRKRKQRGGGGKRGTELAAPASVLVLVLLERGDIFTVPLGPLRRRGMEECLRAVVQIIVPVASRLRGLAEIAEGFPESCTVLLLGQGEYQRADCRTSRVGASICLLYTSPSPRDRTRSRMPSSA